MGHKLTTEEIEREGLIKHVIEVYTTGRVINTNPKAAIEQGEVVSHAIYGEAAEIWFDRVNIDPNAPEAYVDLLCEPEQRIRDACEKSETEIIGELITRHYARAGYQFDKLSDRDRRIFGTPERWHAFVRKYVTG